MMCICTIGSDEDPHPGPLPGGEGGRERRKTPSVAARHLPRRRGGGEKRLVGGFGPEGEGVVDGAVGELTFGPDGELGAWGCLGVFDHGEADGDGAEHWGDC